MGVFVMMDVLVPTSRLGFKAPAAFVTVDSPRLSATIAPVGALTDDVANT